MRTTSQLRPIYVIGGFLGSGKTTLLRGILQQVRRDGARPAVIMNEYGESSVDGKLLGGHGDEDGHGHERDLVLQELVSGCVCCDLSGGLTDAVTSLLRSTAGPIFVETTGLAVVGQVAAAVQRALASGGPGPARARLASVVVAVDATRFSQIDEIWKHGRSDVAAADTLVITKCDRVKASTVVALKKLLRRQNPGARVFSSANSDLAGRLLLHPPARRPRPTKAGNGRTANVVNSAAGFVSVTCKILGPMDIEKLGPLLGRFVPALARVKGFVKTTGHSGLQALQWVPGALEVTPHRGGRVVPHLVAIAQELDWDKFVDALDSAVAPKDATRSVRA